ncbi:hypothetical protein [Microbacterium sp. LWH3-1.2]|uniref:hypothetical protein n=1 Tax=Microbacterium sp. LWH3-1.2 TaxID=3135256 RepID=UPI00341D69DB
MTVRTDAGLPGRPKSGAAELADAAAIEAAASVAWFSPPRIVSIDITHLVRAALDGHSRP